MLAHPVMQYIVLQDRIYDAFITVNIYIVYAALLR